jgi:hypothetical protein
MTEEIINLRKIIDDWCIKKFGNTDEGLDNADELFHSITPLIIDNINWIPVTEQPNFNEKLLILYEKGNKSRGGNIGRFITQGILVDRALELARPSHDEAFWRGAGYGLCWRDYTEREIQNLNAKTSKNKYGHYNYTTRREYDEGYKRHKNYKCSRHSYPDEVLSSENNIIVTELVNTMNDRKDGLYWGQDGKLRSGFQHGVGFRAWSTDFPEGTILRVTAEVILPK